MRAWAPSLGRDSDADAPSLLKGRGSVRRVLPCLLVIIPGILILPLHDHIIACCRHPLR